MIGKPKSSLSIKHQVIRSLETLSIASIIQSFDTARLQIDSLNPAPTIVGRLIAWKGSAIPTLMPLEPAIVTNVTESAGPQSGPVRASA